MAIYSTAARSIENTSNNRFSNRENVIDIGKDEKLKLQLQTKAMLDQVKNDAAAKSFFENKQKELEAVESENKQEYDQKLQNLKTQIIAEYAKLKNVKSLSDIQKEIDNKLNMLNDKFTDMDMLAEKHFDTRVLSNTGKYKTEDELEQAFNGDFLPSLGALLRLSNDENLKTILKNYQFELMDVKDALFNGSSEFTEDTPKKQEYNIDRKIENHKTQESSPTTYYNLSNLSNKEKKQIVDTYESSRRDKKNAFKGILKEEVSESRLLRQLGGRINKEDFVKLADDILSDAKITALLNDENKDEKEFKKEFKNIFKQNFIDTGRYNKKGRDLLQRNENNIIAKLFLQARKDDPQNIKQELERMANAADRGVEYTEERNAEYLVQKIEAKYVFQFLADFNSDGKVDGEPDGDRGSLTGLAMENIFKHYADTQTDPENKNRNIIIDGPRTSILIENILKGVRDQQPNGSSLTDSITYFLEGGEVTTSDGTKVKVEKPAVTMENFHNFMKGESSSFGEGWDQIVITPASKDIKAYLARRGQDVNASRGAETLFTDKKALQSKIASLAKNYTSSTEAGINSPYNSIRYKKELNDQINNLKDKDGNPYRTKVEAAIQGENKAEKMKQMKEDGAGKIFFFVAKLTSYIYANLSDYPEMRAAAFANAAGQLEFRALMKESDPEKVKSNIGNYLLNNLSLSIAETGNLLSPVIGLKIWENKNPLTEKAGGRINKKRGNIGTSGLINLYDLSQSGLEIHLGGEYVRQTNKNKTTDFASPDAVAWKGFGVEGGIGIHLTKLNISPYIGIFREKDFVLGIEQKAGSYERMMQNILPNTYTDIGSYQSQAEKNLDNISGLSSKNKDFLKDEINACIVELKACGVRDKDSGLGNHKVITMLKDAYIQGNKENISEEAGGKLDRKIKLTKYGVRFNLLGLLGAVGSKDTVGNIVRQNIQLRAQFTRYKASREKDPKRAIDIYKTMNRMDGLSRDPESYETLESMAIALESDIEGVENYLSVKAENNTIKISADSERELIDKDILSYVNVYFDPKIRDKFSYKQDGSLTIGNDVTINTYKVIGAKGVEVCVFLEGKENDIAEPINMVPLSPVGTDTDPKELAPIQQEIIESTPVDQTKLKGLKAEKSANGTQETTDALNTQYQEWLKTQTDIANKNLVNATIVASKTGDTFSFEIKDLGSAPRAKDNKITLIYEEVLPGKEGAEGEVTSTELFAFDNFPSEIQNAHKLLEGLKNALEEAENGKTKAYGEFMSAMSNVLDTSWIDATEIQAATDAIKIILKDAKFVSIVNALDESNEVTKAFILDELKMLFAKEPNYSNKSLTDKDGNPIWPFARGDHFATTLRGPLNQVFIGPLAEDLLNKKIAAFSKLKGEKFKDNADVISNIIGYTAYYRDGQKIDGTNKRYSITALGQTTMQGSPEDISEDQQSSAREWFAGNLNVQKNEVELLSKLIEKKTKIKLGHTDIITLVRAGKLEKDGKEITLDSKMVFYLAGSCANESVGLQIGKITVIDKNANGGGGSIGGTEGDKIIYKGEIAPDGKEGFRAHGHGVMTHDQDLKVMSRKIDLGFVPGRERAIPPMMPIPGTLQPKVSEPIPENYSGGDQNPSGVNPSNDNPSGNQDGSTGIQGGSGSEGVTGP